MSWAAHTLVNEIEGVDRLHDASGPAAKTATPHLCRSRFGHQGNPSEENEKDYCSRLVIRPIALGAKTQLAQSADIKDPFATVDY